MYEGGKGDMKQIVAHLDADFPGAHIPTAQPKLPHAGKRQLAQVALFDAAGDQGHGDVTLDAVYTHPWRYKRQQPCHLPYSYNPSYIVSRVASCCMSLLTRHDWIKAPMCMH